MTRKYSFLFCGDYLIDYNRTKILRKGLHQLGHVVTDFSFKKKNSDTLNQLKKLSSENDFIFMPPFTHREVKFVRKSIGKKMLIFDPLISRYLTKVHDYKLVKPWSFSALRNYYRDKWSMQIADLVITDTVAHANFFETKFGISKKNLAVVYIGNDFEAYYPDFTAHSGSGVFKVGFYGGFIPLQGVMNILAAAKILKAESHIQFEMIGNGFEYEKAKEYINLNKLENVNLPGWVSEDELRRRIQKFDLALGIFGDTEKSDLVIPNKVYHYAACAKPILTKDSMAIRELFTDQKDIYFSSTDPNDIANRILTLRSEQKNLIRIGENAYNLLNSRYNALQIASSLIQHIERRL